MHEPSLKQANALLSHGHFTAAAEMFRDLKKKTPSTRIFDIGLEIATRKLERQPPEARRPEFIHPSSEEIKSSQNALFCVVTPVRNGAPYLLEAMESVLSQRGEFFIDYFVKDAESTDGTLGYLRDFGDRIASGNFPLSCKGIRFRFASAPDHGLYDGLATAFSQPFWRCDPKNILTYINSDDYYHEGAFAVVARVFAELPARWVCGQINTVSETKELLCTPDFPLTYAREDILAGLHNGEDLYFIQQEGNFWLRELYDQCGGINPSLRLVGDFDLWTRFARETEPLALCRPLASFRYREGQLSGGMEQYFKELNDILQRPSAPDQVSIGSHESKQKYPFYFPARKAPRKAVTQRPGAICFLNADDSIREVAYMKRGWYCW
jgi:hypothetical protein